jgi:hypothetical protein
MPLDHTLSGRMERRLPIIAVVRLAQLEGNSGYASEWTYTDNISAHGARIFTKRLWQFGEEITLTPFNEETACGNVVYCQMAAEGRFWVGVKLKDHPVPWRAIKRYDGIQIGAPVTSTSS